MLCVATDCTPETRMRVEHTNVFTLTLSADGGLDVRLTGRVDGHCEPESLCRSLPQKLRQRQGSARTL